ncbi:dienelactone hydrolase family protein, partial [Diplocarpon rosae]
MDPTSPSCQGHSPIYPPLPQAVLPVARGLKRKRTFSGSRSSADCSTSAQIREQYNHQCWHCGASPVDVCHVIGSRDQTFGEACKSGLIDFNGKNNPQNAIALCPLCHQNFDPVYNPSFFFLPTDLELSRRTGEISVRTCPTAQNDQDHQIQQGIESAEVRGLYTRLVINDFLSQYPGRAPFRPGLREYGATKSWTGSPMASLHHAVLMLQKLDLHGIPQETRDALRHEEFPLDSSHPSSQESVDLSSVSEKEDHEEGKREKFEENTREPRARPQPSGAEQSSACGNREHGCEELAVNEDKEGTDTGLEKNEVYSEAHVNVARSGHQCIDSTWIPGISPSSWKWEWESGATSEDAVQFFRRVF